APQDDGQRRREQVTGKVLTLDRRLEETLPYLLALLGDAEATATLALMDPQLKRQRTFDAITQVLLRESLKQPVLLLIEDLHWLDRETEAWLHLLSERLATVRLLLLVNYRPEYQHAWGSKTYYTQLRLDPLGPAEAQELLTTLVGEDGGAPGGAILQTLKQLILDKTEGNPFFIEEIVQGLVEQGGLVRAGAGGEQPPWGGRGRPVGGNPVARHGAGRVDGAHRPAAGGGEGAAADPGGGREDFCLEPARPCRGAAGGGAAGAAGAPASGGIHLRTAGLSRVRVYLQARPDPGGGVQFAAPRAAPGAARTHSAGDRGALCGPPGRALRGVVPSLQPQRQHPESGGLPAARRATGGAAVGAGGGDHPRDSGPGPAPDAAGEPGATPAGTGAAAQPGVDLERCQGRTRLTGSAAGL